MALVSMRKVTLLALSADKPRLMRAMQRLGCVQIEEGAPREGAPSNEAEKARLADIVKQIERLDLCILRLTPFDGHGRGLFDVRRAVNGEQVASVVAARREVMDVVERMEQIERSRGELRAREARLRAQIAQLAPWEDLSVPLCRLGRTKTCELLLLSVPAKAFGAFAERAKALGALEIEVISQTREGVNALVAAHGEVLAALEPLIGEADARRVRFEGMRGTAALQIDQMQGGLKRIDEVRERLSGEVRALAGHLPVLRVLRDVNALARDRLGASLLTQDTRTSFLLTGWVPKPMAGQLGRELKRVAPLCEVEFADPGEGEKPPTLMRNGRMVEPFEAVVKMFSAPDPNGIDPTFMMMPFWVCFFGMMVGDAGYGILLGLAAGYLFHRLGRRSGVGRMAFILMLGGVSAAIWGALYGGWFSIPNIPPLLFSPLDEPLKMVGLCLGVGVLHLFSGIGLAAYLNVRRGKPMDALYDQLSWMLILIGLGTMALNAAIGGVVAGIGALTVLLMAGRGHKNPVRRILSGLGTLYGISGYVSDILSYVRLFGMGLATGVIGMVFNMLAGMMMNGVGWVFAILLLLVGHTFNLSINALGAYVHSCRLQFIEFFGKFYESGGRDFVPLAANTRYVDIQGGENPGDIAA